MNFKMPKFSYSWLSIPALLAFWMLTVMVMDLSRAKQPDLPTCKFVPIGVHNTDARASVFMGPGTIQCDLKYSAPRTVPSPYEVYKEFEVWVQPQVLTREIVVKNAKGEIVRINNGEIQKKTVVVIKDRTEERIRVKKEKVIEKAVVNGAVVEKETEIETCESYTYHFREKRTRPNGEVYYVNLKGPVSVPIKYDQKQYGNCETELMQSWRTMGSLGPHVWQSFQEVFVGFILACIVAIILGFWAGFNKNFREFITPLNGILMSIPAIAWAPMMLLIFPVKFVAIVVVVYIAAVSPMIIAIMEGILTITGQEVRAARALGCKPMQLFIYIYIPASLPFITAGMRIGFSQAWRALVAAEIMNGVGRGLGQVINLSNQVGDNASMMLAIVMIGFLSYLFERLIFRRMEKHYEVWRIR